MNSHLTIKAIFLDRDETLNHDPGYISDPELIQLKDNVVKGLTRLKELDYKFFIFSNQSGIGRKYFTIDQLNLVNQRLLDRLSEGNIQIEKIYICPHTEKDNCKCRKPEPGMLLDAMQDYEIDKEKSFIIGDRIKDIQSGSTLSIKGILVHSKVDTEEEKFCPNNLVYEARDILDAAEYIENYSFLTPLK